MSNLDGYSGDTMREPDNDWIDQQEQMLEAQMLEASEKLHPCLTSNCTGTPHIRLCTRPGQQGFYVLCGGCDFESDVLFTIEEVIVWWNSEK